MFHVGQKVVCIDGVPTGPSWGFGWEFGPVSGCIYTIREVTHRFNGPGLLLVEIMNEVADYADGRFEMSFRARRFRPVVERKTDISIFQAMLDPKHEQVSA